jgi:ASC-1-like (ASCH) protein
MQNRLLSSTNRKRTHVAIMKADWGLTDKILTGEKTIESRWYMKRYRPWNKINKGDIIYFKDSGNPVTVKAEVTKVDQYANIDEAKRTQIMSKYSLKQLGATAIKQELEEYTKDKNYAIFVHLANPQKIKPFDIDKTGYGAMAAWLIVKDIDQIKS